MNKNYINQMWYCDTIDVTGASRTDFAILTILVLTASSLLSSTTAHDVYAQQDFGIHSTFGIPLTSILAATLVILGLYGVTIALVKPHKAQIILGSIVAFLGVIVTIILSPVFLYTSIVGTDFSYCRDNPCNENSAIVTLDGYNEVAPYPPLNEALRSPGVVTINQLEDLSLYPLLSSTVKLDKPHSSENAYLIKFRGDLYVMVIKHLDADFNYAEYGTLFTLDALYITTLIPAFGFFSFVLPATKNTSMNHFRTLNLSRVMIGWLSSRRISIPLIGIAVFPLTFLAALVLGSDYHSFTWDIILKMNFSLLGYIAAIVIARKVERRRLMSPA